MTRSNKVTVYVNDEELSRLDREAGEADMSRSAHILPTGIRPADVAAISGTFDGETSLGVHRMKWEVAPFGIGEWGSLDRFEPDGDRPVFFVSDVLAGEVSSEAIES